MADTVSTVTLLNSPQRLVVKFLNLSDGTGESNVVKVDKSTYTGPNGLEPSYFDIEYISYDIGGMSVALVADHDTDVVLTRLSGYGSGCQDFRSVGNMSTAGTGGSGDLLLTTNGHTSGDTYDIVVSMMKIN